MKLAFYKDKKRFLDKLISWWTRPNIWKFWEMGPYSHVEILFENNLCFSVSPRESRCRWKYITDIETSGKWDLYQITDDQNTISQVKLSCSVEEGKSYDWICIFFNFILPFDEQVRDKWICSELAAKKVFHLRKAYKYDPNKLFFKIVKPKYK